MVAVTVLFGAGILLQPAIHVSAMVQRFTLSGIALVTIFLLRLRWLSNLLLAVGLILAGAGFAQQELEQFRPDDLGLFSTDGGQLTQVDLRLIEEPLILATADPQRKTIPAEYVPTGAVAILTVNGWKSASGMIDLRIKGVQPELHAGQLVRAMGQLERPAAAQNPGQFDWAEHYRQQRVLCSFYIDHPTDVRVLQDSPPGLFTSLRIRARHLLAAGFTNAHSLDLALLETLVLGDRDSDARSVHEQFQQLGIAYALSISGLHILLLAAVAWGVLRLARVRPRAVLFIITGLIVMYGLIAVPSFSGLRWITLWVIAAMATVLRRGTDRLQILSVAVLAMLFYHPLDVYSSGLQLGLVVVLAFVILLPRLEMFVLSFRDPHMVVAEPLIQRTTAQMILREIAGWFGKMSLLSVVAWSASLPLVAVYYGKLNPVGLLASILLLPLVLSCLFSGLFKIICTLLYPPAIISLAAAAAQPASWLRDAVAALLRLPGGNLVLPQPTPTIIIIYYALLLVPLIPFPVDRRRWFLRASPLVGILLLLGLPVVGVATGAPQSAGLRFTLLSLGAGQCAVLEPPQGQPEIFDAGSTNVPDLTERIVGPFLREEHQSRVEDIFLSHGDYDHISAAGDIAATFGVHHVFISPYFRRNGIGNIPDQELLERLEQLKLPPLLISQGDHPSIADNCSLQVLWPPAVGNYNSNNAGLVLKLSYAGKTILMPADIQDPAFAGLLQHPENLKSDILVAPHHGSSESLTPAFLRAVHPDFIISSNAWRLTNKQKRFDAMVGKIPLYRTSDYGAITVTIKADGTVTIATFLRKTADDIRGFIESRR